MRVSLMYQADIAQLMGVPQVNDIEIYILHMADQLLDNAVYWLNADERKRLQAISHPINRRNFICVHAALQQLIASKTNHAAPLQWQYNHAGKPYLKNSPIRFSMAHSGAVALIAVTLDIDIGVDIEKIRPLKNKKIISKYFNELDIKSGINFFDLWVRREALAKASGVGLAHTRRQLQFSNDKLIVDGINWCITPLPIEPLAATGSHKAAIAFAADPKAVCLRIFDYELKPRTST